MARSRSAASGPRECLSRWPLQCRDLRWRTQEPRVLSHKFEGLVRKYDQAICYGNCAIYFGQWWKLSSKAMSFFFCLSSGRQFASRKSFIRIVDSVHFLSVWGTQCSIRAAFERGGGFTLQLSRFVSYWSTKTSRIPCQAASHGSWGCHELNSTERNLGSRGHIGDLNGTASCSLQNISKHIIIKSGPLMISMFEFDMCASLPFLTCQGFDSNLGAVKDSQFPELIWWLNY